MPATNSYLLHDEKIGGSTLVGGAPGIVAKARSLAYPFGTGVCSVFQSVPNIQ